MRIQHIVSAGLAALLLGLASTGASAQPAPAQPAPAQPAPADPGKAEAERAKEVAQAERERTRQAERERAQQAAEAQRDRAPQRADAEKERSELERDLEAARNELQKAAREVARLSGEMAAPFVDGISRGFRFAGQRAMLGVGIEDTERGVRIASVSPNGPGAEAGLKVGDTIIAIEGAALADTRVAGGGKQSPSEILLGQMANVDAGESVKLRVLNEKGGERDVAVKAREISPFLIIGPNPPLPPMPAPKGQAYTYNYNYGGPGQWIVRSSPWAQMQLVPLTAALGTYFGTSKGLLVVRGPESDVLGLRDGDVILDIGGREPTTPEHAIRILGSFEPGEAMKITVMRDKRRQTLDVKVPVQGNG